MCVSAQRSECVRSYLTIAPRRGTELDRTVWYHTNRDTSPRCNRSRWQVWSMECVNVYVVLHLCVVRILDVVVVLGSAWLSSAQRSAAQRCPALSPPICRPETGHQQRPIQLPGTEKIGAPSTPRQEISPVSAITCQPILVSLLRSVNSYGPGRWRWRCRCRCR